MEHSVYFGYGTLQTDWPGTTVPLVPDATQTYLTPGKRWPEGEVITHGVDPSFNLQEVIPMYQSGRKNGLFRGVNTWDDWHLIPSSRPEIAPAEVYTNYVDLPGCHGKLDLSEYLTGGPVYKNRTGSLEFVAANGYHFWAETYNQMCNYLHGQKLFMVLEDEPEYFYTGRFRVQKWNSDGKTNWSTVAVDYELDPFKFILPRVVNDQYWDRFLFEDTHSYEHMHIDAKKGAAFAIHGYTHGFMLDATFAEDSAFPAEADIYCGSQHMKIRREAKDDVDVRTGVIYPMTNATNFVVVASGANNIYVDLFYWGGHL